MRGSSSWDPGRRQLACIGAATLAGFIAIAAAVLIFSPYFGNMDDSVHMELAGQAGPWVFHHFGDPATGFVRHASWVLIWPQYAVAAATHSAELLYIANALLVFLILLVFGLAARAYFAWPKGSAYVVLIGSALAWPYFAELFVFPSLQEKAVILGASLLLWWSGRARQSDRMWLTVALLLAASVIALTTKTQIVLLLPGLVASLWLGPHWKQPGSILRPLAAALWIAGAVALLWLAVAGDYAASTRGGEGVGGLGALSDRRLLLLLTILGAYSLALLLRWRLSTFDARSLVPWIWIATSASAFLVWEVRNYYLAVAAMGVSVAVAQVASWIKPRPVAIGVACLAMSLGILMSATRSTTIFSITGSFRVFLSSTEVRELDAAAAEVGVGCAEAPTHFNRYAQWMGLESLTFYDATGGRRDSSPWLLADDRLCPLAITADSTVIWSPPRNPGYVLHSVNGIGE